MFSFSRAIISLLLVSAVLLGAAACEKQDGPQDSDKIASDPNRDSLLMLLTFDNDENHFFAKNAAGEGAPYAVENLRNDVTANKFYREPSPARRTKGVSGSALSFDGYSNYLGCGALVAGKSAFTVNLWAAIRAYDFVDTTRSITPLAEYYDARSDSGFIFGYTHHGKWGIRVKTASGWQEVWAERYLDLYTWHNLCVTYGDGKLTLYYNGEIAASASFTCAELPAQADFKIGLNTFKQTGGIFKNNCFAGLLDEYKVYDKALSAGDVRGQFELYASNGRAPELTYADMAYPDDYLADNVYRTTWHGGPPVNWVSDINGGFYYNGKYHIFYTKSDLGPTLGGVSWGHMVSDDLVGWSEVQPAIWSEDNGIDGRWVFAGSGGVVNGVPYIFYTGYVMSPANTFVCTVGMATPEDPDDPELKRWKKLDDVRLRLPPSGYNLQEYRDPQIYIEGDTVFLMIVSRTDRGNPCIVAWSAPVDDVRNWTFRGTVFEVDYGRYQESGYMWEVPVFLRLKSEGGLTKYALAFAPMGTDSNDSIYFLGDFDAQTCRFTPDSLEVKRWDYGADYFMCAGGQIYDPVGKQTVVFELLQCCWNLTEFERYQSGYSGVLAMGRVYGLSDDGELTVRPYSGYESLHGERLQHFENEIASDFPQDFRPGRSYHARVSMDLFNENSRAGFELLSGRTGIQSLSFYYDCRKSRFVLDTFKTSNSSIKSADYLDYPLRPGEKVVLDIFVDTSCVEIFINGEYAMSARAYNGPECDYLKVIGGDWLIERMDVYFMKGIY